MEQITAFTKILELLRAQPVLTLFLILGAGYLMLAWSKSPARQMTESGTERQIPVARFATIAMTAVP